MIINTASYHHYSTKANMNRDFIHPADAKLNAVQKAKEMRNKSKVPRVRTMKKILKRVKDKNRQKSAEDVKKI